MANQVDQAQDESNTSRAWRALMAYRGLSLQVFDTHSQSFDQLPQADRALIPSMLDRLSHAVEAVEQNAVLVEKISKLAGIRKQFSPQEMTDLQLQQSVEDFSDVIDALLYVVRDWSLFGEKDRAQMYDPVIRSVHDAAVDAVSSGVVPDISSYSVLVPGAAVGRLPWELAHMGMTVQGVENSALHLLLCNFILNGTASPKKPLTFFPFVHHTGTANTAHDQLAEVDFPDADPRELENGELSMVTGEFLDQYNEENSWDCVVTCFYIDNCHDVIAVIQSNLENFETWRRLG